MTWGQIGVLSEQFATMGRPNGLRRQMNPRFADEDKYSDQDEPINPFAENHVVHNHTSRWESRFKLDIPEFQGGFLYILLKNCTVLILSAMILYEKYIFLENPTQLLL